VLDASEALLLQGSDQFAITNARRRRNAVETIETNNVIDSFEKNRSGLEIFHLG
jgi:hypothetical protein